MLVEADQAPRHTPQDDQWHHTVSSLTLHFAGSEAPAWTVQVRGTPEGLEVLPTEVGAAATNGAVELGMPLELFLDNPVQLYVFSRILCYGNEDQVASEGSDRLPDSGALVIQMPGVPLDTEPPRLSEVQAARLGARHALLS